MASRAAEDKRGVVKRMGVFAPEMNPAAGNETTAGAARELLCFGRRFNIGKTLKTASTRQRKEVLPKQHRDYYFRLYT
jgi:hypothetical protein